MYYVHTPVDGNEDGRWNFNGGLTLGEAKQRARWASLALRDAGVPLIDTVAQVLEIETSNYVWSCDAETAVA